MLSETMKQKEKRELQEFKDRFNKNYEVSKKNNKNFGDTFSTIVKEHNIDRIDFWGKTGISERTYDRWKANCDDVSMKYIVIFAIAFKLDLLTVATLLHSGGYEFNLSKARDYAYAYLIMYHSGKDINKCNEILKELGLPKDDLLKIRKYKSEIDRKKVKDK